MTTQTATNRIQTGIYLLDISKEVANDADIDVFL